VSQAYRLTERAEADVEAIADFIAADSIDAAVKVVLALEDAFVLLASRPGIGHAREDLTDRPPKFWSVHSYLVVCDPGGDPLTIVGSAARRTQRRADPQGDRLKLGSAR
jgi:toxin ParE1/3/4